MWRNNWTQNICQPTTIQCFEGFFLGPADVLSQNELPLSGPAPLRWKGSEDGCTDTRPQWAEERRTKWPATVCFLPKENSCFSLLPLILFKGPGRVWQLEGNRDRVTRGTGLWFGGNDNKWPVWMWRSVGLFVILSYWCWCINNWKHLVRRLDVWKFDRIL